MDLGDILNEMSQTADKGRCCVILPVRDQNGQTHRLRGMVAAGLGEESQQAEQSSWAT